MTTEAFVGIVALVGVVVLVSGLLSGFIERSNAPQVVAFLAIGLCLGPSGLGLMDVGIDSPALRVVATLGLTLVLFTDALGLDVREIRRHMGLTLAVLGPGTLLTAGLVAFAAWALLGLSPALAAILGSALASTDPVLIRGLLRRPDVPSTARLALRLESGLNDVVLLPVILVAMAILARNGESVAGLLVKLFVLGPGAGVLVGLASIGALHWVRSRVGMRRDYESLYALGVAFTAFAAAEAFHSSGFLAAFAAGLTIAWLDVELCDCFREYGETTAEMALLFAFVFLGSSLIWSGLAEASWASVAFAGLALLAKPLGARIALIPVRTTPRARRTILWFGPRGLSTLLLVLVPVFGATPGAASLFAPASLVVVASIAIFGTVLWVGARRSEPVEAPQIPESPEFEVADPVLITVAELLELRRKGPVVLLDARSMASYDASDERLADAIRIDPERPTFAAASMKLGRDAWIAALCT